MFLTCSPVPLGLFLHPLQPRGVVGELVEVRERDLRGDVRVVVGDVGDEVVQAVLEFDSSQSDSTSRMERPRKKAPITSAWSGSVARKRLRRRNSLLVHGAQEDGLARDCFVQILSTPRGPTAG